ncbi:acyl-CoA/acyl-ACP dehydrogenase [Saccharothrix sp. 6-C]|uniref:acyl-CoA dehydrogenase family protein n=1 Tax=Saccharothrix sp. 6-C TaxID=2781735 RepID=UPI001916E54B|nr:acyl-CoA dehydrogenase family protein [Saccharothrix sp. 6-C]QQQ79336.1 acyl-CoA/acyl-ACP dehydrogenase [Saccharothrix sp. 6-C]
MGVESLETGLLTGRLDVGLLGDFPEQDAADRAAGDAWVARAEAFVAEHVPDPDALDATRALPDGLIDALRREGFLTAAFAAELGGAALSPYNVLRVVAAASERSVPVGQIIAIQAGVGVGALHPALPEGPLRDMVRDRIKGGALSGFGDTDQAGQNNRLPAMTATLDGEHYVLRGEKLYTGNGPVADLLAVSATIDGGIGVCFVDTASEGFSVESVVEFVGSNGLPNGALGFDGVRVPKEHVLSGAEGQLRLPAMINSIAFLGRVYFTGAPALAVARNCLRWSRSFVNRRMIDGRPLGEYDRVQRMVSRAMADVYAMDSVARWSLIGGGVTDRWLERFVAKNILTRTAWKLADRTVALMGAEGLETAASKRRRGAPVLPAERALRDARGFRMAGNVDFQLDSQVAQLLLAAYYRGERPTPGETAVDASALDLSPRNQVHLDAVAEQTRWFAQSCAEATRTARAELFADEEFLVTSGRIAAELVAASAVLARTAALGTAEAQDLADVHCTAALTRLAGLWRRLSPDGRAEHHKMSRGWLTGSTFEFLTTT